MPPIFSFIIVNFKSADMLPLWFASLSNTQLLSNEYEVIIVNNDTAEKNTLDTLKQQYNFKLIHTESNIGFGSACNLGTKHALGEILGFINPDTQFLDGDLHTLQDQFHSDASIGVIGLKLLTKQGLVQEWSAGARVTLWDIIRNNLGFPKSKVLWGSQLPINVDWVSGASLFISQDLFRSINGFNEDFFLYFEDTDLCERVRLQGKSILYFPDISLMHISGASSSSSRKQKKHYYASQDLYFTKHSPKWEGWCIKTLRKLFLI